MTTQELILYQREECPYCQLVRKKLTLLQLPFLSMPVEPAGVDRKELIELSGQNEVPVLVHNGDVIIGSREILNYLDETFADGKKEQMPSNVYGFSTTMKGTLDQVKEKATVILKEHGFGVLTEINVHETLKKKLDIEVPRQLILGACNPQFAHKIMSEEAAVSLLLPCNVTIRELEEENTFKVSIVSPVKLLAVVGRSDLLPLAMEARNKLKSVLDQFGS